MHLFQKHYQVVGLGTCKVGHEEREKKPNTFVSQMHIHFRGREVASNERLIHLRASIQVSSVFLSVMRPASKGADKCATEE